MKHIHQKEKLNTKFVVHNFHKLHPKKKHAPKENETHTPSIAKMKYIHQKK